MSRLFGPGSMGLAVYGAIAAGLALAIGVDTTLSTVAIAIAVLVELVAFYAAHVYADTIGQRYDRPEVRWPQRLNHCCRHDLAILFGGLPILGAFVLERIVGLDRDRSATIALIVLIALLGGYGCLAARRSGVTWAQAVGEGAIAALIGLGILLLKLLLH